MLFADNMFEVYRYYHSALRTLKWSDTLIKAMVMGCRKCSTVLCNATYDIEKNLGLSTEGLLYFIMKISKTLTKQGKHHLFVLEQSDNILRINTT